LSSPEGSVNGWPSPGRSLRGPRCSFADLGLALLFISHDLGVIHHVSDRLLVMRDGQVVETGEVGEVLSVLPSSPTMAT